MFDFCPGVTDVLDDSHQDLMREESMFILTDACFPVTHAERRRAPRRFPAGETQVRFLDNEGRLLGTGLVWNVSLTGISILVSSNLSLESRVDAELFCEPLGSTLRRPLRVIHRTRMRTGDDVVGAQFQVPLLPEEMESLLGPHTRATCEPV